MIDYETPKRSFLHYVLYVMFKWKGFIMWSFLLWVLSLYLATKLSFPIYLGITKVWVHKGPSQQVTFMPDLQIPNIASGFLPVSFNWIESLTGQHVSMEVAKKFHLDDYFRERSQNPQNFREDFWYYLKWPIKFVLRSVADLAVYLGLMEEVTWKKDYLSVAARRVNQDMVVVAMANQLSDVMAISVFGPTRELAQGMANYLAEVLIEKAVQGEQNVARFAVDFAEGQLNEITAKLHASEEDLLAYQKSMGVLEIAQQKTLQVNTSDQLQSQLLSLETAGEELKKKVQVLDEQIEDQKRAFVSSVILQKSIVEKQEAVLNLAINHEKKMVVEKHINETKDRAQELIEAETVSSKLKREIQIYSSIWSQFQDKLAKLKIETVSRLKASAMEVVDPAYIPESEEPVWPKDTVCIIIGIILGLGTGLFGAYFLEYFNDGLRNDLEVQKELNLPVIGSIPEFDLENPS